MGKEKYHRDRAKEAGVVLKPCPFCGGEARLKKHYKMQDTWYVQCNKCKASGGLQTQSAFEHWTVSRDRAIWEWNNRFGEPKEDFNTWWYARRMALVEEEKRIRHEKVQRELN